MQLSAGLLCSCGDAAHWQPCQIRGAHTCMHLTSVPAMQLWSHWAVAMTFLAWAEADIVRYLWYALSLAGSPPHLLTWLRCCQSGPTTQYICAQCS